MPDKFISRRRRKKSNAAAVGVIATGTLICFAVAFVLFWALGSRLAGGNGLGLPGLSHSPSGPETASAAVVGAEPITLPVPVDLARFRDLAYTPVKGIYVSSWGAGSASLFPKMLAIADNTEINAMVIDVKDSTGYVSYDCSVPAVHQYKLWEWRIRDPAKMMDTLNEHKVFPIARIVCFNDPLLATKKPEWAIKNVNGGIWEDNKGSSYTNPYNRQVWKYLVDLAEDAADRGFREIQFDYVRFPTDGKISETSYPGKWGTQEDAIAEFLRYARGRLEKKGVWVAADVFGLVVHVKDDMRIGQKAEKIARAVDVVCPMIYPSHYSAGDYGIQNPNASPYDTVIAASKDAAHRLEGTGAIYRPWLQDFSLGGVTYGVAEVKAQIRAVEEAGFNEWLLWDPSLKYTEDALRAESDTAS